MQITIMGNPITKKNSSRVIGMGKRCPVCHGSARHIIIPSKQYEKYEKQSASYIPSVYRLGIDYPVNIKCSYYMETRRKVDLVNLLEATCDILVKYGVLADDNSTIVAAMDGSKVYHDKQNPRVEIEITRLEG